jgi:hypothetical protein
MFGWIYNLVDRRMRAHNQQHRRLFARTFADALDEHEPDETMDQLTSHALDEETLTEQRVRKQTDTQLEPEHSSPPGYSRS